MNEVARVGREKIKQMSIVRLIVKNVIRIEIRLSKGSKVRACDTGPVLPPIT